MKFPMPAAAAHAGAAQAQIETDTIHPGLAFALYLATPLAPTHQPGSAAQPRLCFRSPMAPRHHLRGGDAVSSLN